CDGINWSDLRSLVAHEWRIRDEDLAAMPEISRHDKPQDSPQEYDCGCVAVTRVTDRDTRCGERPFEMRLATARDRACGRKPFERRLAIACGTASCEVSRAYPIGLGQKVLVK